MCMTVRAVYFEVLQTLATDSLILQCKDLFPEEEMCDVYTPTMELTSLEQKNILESKFKSETTVELLNVWCKEKWIGTCNNSLASLFGGFWERMLQSMRKILTSITCRPLLQKKV